MDEVEAFAIEARSGKTKDPAESLNYEYVFIYITSIKVKLVSKYGIIGIVRELITANYTKSHNSVSMHPFPPDSISRIMPWDWQRC